MQRVGSFKGSSLFLVGAAHTLENIKWNKNKNTLTVYYLHLTTVVILTTYLISFFKLMSRPGCILNVTLLLFIITSLWLLTKI
jgi:hypothetical protein